MIIIGEKINSTLKTVRTAIEKYDAAAIQELAKKQYNIGASYIDVNAGELHEDEPERLAWLVNTIQDVLDVPFSIDSPNPKAIEAALKTNKNPKPIINSITDEKERYNAIVPLAAEYKTGIIALCMDDEGMPETVDGRIKIAERLVEKLTREGIPPGDIYIDPMIRPIGTGSHYGMVALETMRRIRAEIPEVHIVCGLSNISFGIPARKLMNRAFLVAAMTAGMDAAILDPLDKKLMSFVYATEALLGKDDYCMNYINKFREGEIEL
ncbi:MAG TPA: methyltetrahydrofolate cobalamin methyltransferase [Clostridiaceae bacterium]|nr:methyltetrahydrofolate cobalamin methyltransferase [Clostridiaceae bacterium]